MTDPVAAGDKWRVDRIGAAYRVTLQLTSPVPVRNAMPMLAVNGEPIGVAQEHGDRRTLTLITRDARVAKARDVSLTWSPGRIEPAKRAAPSAKTAVPVGPYGAALAVDPGARGRYPVTQRTYDFGDQAVYLPSLGKRVEFRGVVYAPRGAKGPRPIVIFLHGRHSYCYGPEPGPDNWPDEWWPCPKGMKPVPSYLGYAAPAKTLASHGYVVVSISANGVNALDWEAVDGGAEARGQLVLAHLDRWWRWSSVGGSPFRRAFVGRIDFTTVGLMGHSRGGEGVVRATLLNAARHRPYGIKALLPLAPTDFARQTMPDVAMSVMLPYCDGDVWDLQGQQYFDDTRYAATGDQALRSTVLVMGANHNYFNTEWTPGLSRAPSWDDWWGDPAEGPCGADHAERLNPAEQQAVARAYVAGFFRMMLGGETALLPIFNGSGARAKSAGRAVVQVVAQAPAAARVDVTRFDRPLPNGTVTGRATAKICAGMEFAWYGYASSAPSESRIAPCTSSLWPPQAPHWTPAALATRAPMTPVTHLRWTGASGRVRVAVPKQARDVRRFAALAFRIAPDPDVGRSLDLTVRVVDGNGRAAAVSVSAVSNSLQRLPGAGDVLPKTIMRTVWIPLAKLNGISLKDVRYVELRTDRVSSGAAYLADLAFVRSSIGKSGPSKLPQLTVSDVTMKEGNTGTRFAVFNVNLSRPSRLPVRLHAETVGIWEDEAPSVVRDISKELVFPAGRTRLKVAVPVRPNRRDGPDVRFSLLLAVSQEAIVADPLGAGLVLDDDPPPQLRVSNASAVEGAGLMRFRLTLSAPSDNFVALIGVLHSGTAALNRDFSTDNPDMPDTVWGVVDPGETTGWMEVPLINDARHEATEIFTMTLKDPVHAVLVGPTLVTGTILDDD